jgi:hypothetical protein
LFGEQTLGEVHAFGQLRQILAHLLHLLEDFIALGGVDAGTAM